MHHLAVAYLGHCPADRLADESMLDWPGGQADPEIDTEAYGQ